jgi:hypothetical protein
MTDKPSECAECGGSGRLGTCAELFDALLALDLLRPAAEALGRGRARLQLTDDGATHPPSAISS